MHVRNRRRTLSHGRRGVRPTILAIRAQIRGNPAASHLIVRADVERGKSPKFLREGQAAAAVRTLPDAVSSARDQDVDASVVLPALATAARQTGQIL